MRIFEVSPDQISSLDEHQLVELTRRLINSEMKSNGIPIRSGTVQTQIHIPDGGEDGYVSWQDGPNQTNYFPSRMNIFQIKKHDPGPARMRRETQKKSSGKDGKPPEINDALAKALEKNGSYIMITAVPIVGSKRDKRIEDIKDGISEAGRNPSLLNTIEIYDNNKLADWTKLHPSVALWLNSISSEIDLHGFRTYEIWSKDKIIHKVAFQNTDEKRYRLLNKRNSNFNEKQDIDQLKFTIGEFFKSSGRSVRIIGPSGYGKTRLTHKLFQSYNYRQHENLDPRQIIYCEYEDVKDRLNNIARDIAESNFLCILVVDDCPDEIHKKLHDIAGIQDSKLRLITLGFETLNQGVEDNLVIELTKASDNLIDKIVKAFDKEISDSNSSYVSELAQGFPSMAILAAEAIHEGDYELSGVDAIVSRIVWGDSHPDKEAYRSLQVLSLFTIFGIDNEAGEELKQISVFLKRSYETVFEDINRFSNRGVIQRLGDFAEVQPVPLSMSLANQWLNSSPSGTLRELFTMVSPSLQLRIIGRLRWLSQSEEVQDFADKILPEIIPNSDRLNTNFDSEMLDRLVHLNPNSVMNHLDFLLSGLSIEDLTKLRIVRLNNIARTLGKLVFRDETFELAADLLLRLSAADNESDGGKVTKFWGGPFTTLFLGLFKLYLSGAVVGPQRKLRVLDKGLASDDYRVRAICVYALNSMLKTRSFSRGGGQERIGAGRSPKRLGATKR